MVTHGVLLDASLILLVCLLIVVLPAVAVVTRARWITRQGTSFDCAVRLDRTRPGLGWSLGIARYTGEQVEWFRYFSIRTSPHLRLGRTIASIVSVWDPDEDDAAALYAEHRIVRIECFGDLWDLAMSQESLTGFLAYLESAPPGQNARSLGSPGSVS